MARLRLTLFIQQFIKMEAFAGILLFLASVLALFLANTQAAPFYHQLITGEFSLSVAHGKLSAPFILWINDGLMALFFLLIGLEMKREIKEGELARFSQIVLPGVSAIGGVIVPMAIFIFFNYSHDSYQGWAIPAATDIAFALGILSLLGRRVAGSLRIFLLTLAIFDDIIAIIIITVFYSESLAWLPFIFAWLVVGLLALFNYWQVERIACYLFAGLLLWWLILKSGIHPTLAGVVLGLMIPLTTRSKTYSPLKVLEKKLHPLVVYCILPLFAFANAGVSLIEIDWNDLFHPLTLGIAMGLLLGKQLGIFSCAYVLIKLRWAQLPTQASWSQLYGVTILCGIGFTMSLFISTLSFDAPKYLELSRLGILLGSFFAAGGGYLWLRFLPTPLKAKD